MSRQGHPVGPSGGSSLGTDASAESRVTTTARSRAIEGEEAPPARPRAPAGSSSGGVARCAPRGPGGGPAGVDRPAVSRPCRGLGDRAPSPPAGLGPGHRRTGAPPEHGGGRARGTVAALGRLDPKSDRLAILIDFSGSLWIENDEGRCKKDRLDPQVEQLLSGFSAGTEFLLVPYTREPHPFEPGLVEATGRNIRRAQRFFASARMNGSGDLFEALSLALDRPEVDRVVLLSDGAPLGRGTMEHRPHGLAREGAAPLPAGAPRLRPGGQLPQAGAAVGRPCQVDGREDPPLGVVRATGGLASG